MMDQRSQDGSLDTPVGGCEPHTEKVTLPNVQSPECLKDILGTSVQTLFALVSDRQWRGCRDKSGPDGRNCLSNFFVIGRLFEKIANTCRPFSEIDLQPERSGSGWTDFGKEIPGLNYDEMFCVDILGRGVFANASLLVRTIRANPFMPAIHTLVEGCSAPSIDKRRADAHEKFMSQVKITIFGPAAGDVNCSSEFFQFFADAKSDMTPPLAGLIHESIKTVDWQIHLAARIHRGDVGRKRIGWLLRMRGI